MHIYTVEMTKHLVTSIVHENSHGDVQALQEATACVHGYHAFPLIMVLVCELLPRMDLKQHHSFSLPSCILCCSSPIRISLT